MRDAYKQFGRMTNLIVRSIRGGLRRFGYDIVRHVDVDGFAAPGPIWQYPRGKPLRSILVVSIPKSGSVYINDLLRQGLRRPNVSLSPGYFPHDLADFRKVELFARGGYVASTHFHASEQNLRILGTMLDRWVVHVRDPRSVVVSLAHHLDRHLRIDPRLMFTWAPAPPASFTSMSIEEKLSWTVDNHLANVVAWTRDWLEIVNRGTFNIRLTTYEELHRSETGFAEGLLDFFEIPRSMYRAPAMEKNIEKTHYRSGLLGEWRTVFTPALLLLANKTIGSDLLEWFRWPLL
jgi:hypothetical protein